MGRKSTGTVRLIGGKWYGKWSQEGKRPDGRPNRSDWLPLDPNILSTDRPGAEACAARLAPRMRKTKGPGAGIETVAEYAKRWLDDREGRVHSLAADRSRMRFHVLPTLGPLDVAKFTRDDVERLRDALDKKITTRDLSWKTVGSVWTLVTSMCGDMVNAKKRELRARSDNPAVGVLAPERGERKAKQYLYPSEFLQFVSCSDVPLRLRRATESRSTLSSATANCASSSGTGAMSTSPTAQSA